MLLLASPLLRGQPDFPGTKSAAGEFDGTSLREPADLAATWLVQPGDNPAYANPTWDDSQWLRVGSTTSLKRLLPRGNPGIVWYRLHLHVMPDQTGLALKETSLSSAFEVYSNGVKLMQLGRVAPFVGYTSDAQLMARIPDSQIATGSVVLALRVHLTPVEWSGSNPGLTAQKLTFGRYHELSDHVWIKLIGENYLFWLDSLITLCLGLGALLLFSAQRSRPEYLWLSLTYFCFLLSVPIWMFNATYPFPASWLGVTALTSFGANLFSAFMYLAFLSDKVNWPLRIFLLAACLLRASVHVAEAWDVILTPTTVGFLIAPLYFFNVVVLPILLLVHWRRGNREAGILLVPQLLSNVVFVFNTLAAVAGSIPALHDFALRYGSLLSDTHAGRFLIAPVSVAGILSSLSLALIVILRSNRLSLQSMHFQHELAAAREVQQILLPEHIETVPGFTVDCAYYPAQEVGGDFFQVLPTSEGGLLLVFGDVAGKGLPAAMQVSVLVGAIRTVAAYEQDPDVVLAHLNDRMFSRSHGGFATALAAKISPDGRVIIANAGHLPPYLDGVAVDLPGALPLGVLRGARYELVQFDLHPASLLTFYSDGVVEAQNSKGQLFGFERAKAISMYPAAVIVQDARTFGQSDDITVITITRHQLMETKAKNAFAGSSSFDLEQIPLRISPE